MSARRIAVLYAVVATIFVLLIARTQPPLHGPDEGAHLARASQISHGGVSAYRFDASNSGGTIDLGIIESVRRFYPLIAEGTKPTPSLYAPIPWGRTGLWSFANTAVYPPVFYLPAAAALFLCRHAGTDVLRGEIEARVASGLVSIGIATLAIALAGPAAIWLFALMLLPSSADLMGSVTQDGPMLATAALILSLLLRLLQRECRHAPALLAIGCVGLALLGTSRPPYAALLVLPLLTSAPTRRARILATSLATCVTVAWWSWCAARVFMSADFSGHAHPGAQLAFLAHHPIQLPAIVANTFRRDGARAFAGYFISTFTPAVSRYHMLAWIVLACALAAAAISGTMWETRRFIVVLLAILAAIAGIFLLQYLTWTPPGAPAVDGVLGRYFLPLAVMLPFAFLGPMERTERAPPLARTLLSVPILVFPILSILVSMRDIVAGLI